MINDNGESLEPTRKVRLEELVVPFTGFWGSDQPSTDREELLVLGVGNVTNEGELDLKGATKRYLRREEMGGVAETGDLLVVKSSGSAANIRSGKTAICPPELSGKIACSNFMMRLKVKRDVADPYLLWLILNSHVAKAFIREIVGASTYPNIKWENYRRFEFDLPPLEKQRRIAAQLRERLSIVARARVALEAQLAAADSLSAAHLRGVFESEEAKRWPHQRMGEICERVDYGFTASADFNITSPKFLRITDIQDGRVDWESVPGCKISEAEAKQNEVLQGDIVFARTGATTGKSFLITNPPPAVFASYLIRLRLGENNKSEIHKLFPSERRILEADKSWRTGWRTT